MTDEPTLLQWAARLSPPQTRPANLGAGGPLTAARTDTTGRDAANYKE